MDAALVYDGGDGVRIPASMGTPCGDQMTGTPFERLSECASRICYDSLGYNYEGKRRGRSSDKLHEHILEVQNHSVLEHANFTVRSDASGESRRDLALACLNRKGVWVELPGVSGIEITANLRAVLEWERHTCSANWGGVATVSRMLRSALEATAHRLAPRVVTSPGSVDLIGFHVKTDGLTADQAWVTLWLSMSRGATHEQVRHRFAMSQRSTRYVDEDGSPYVTHPLVTRFLGDESVPLATRGAALNRIDASVEADRETYRFLVSHLQGYLTAAGADRAAARKQARGASRGYLGNALASEMLFSAPVSGWRWILKQRKNKLADAELRAVYTPALEALRSSRYGHFFGDFATVPSPDGLGTVLA
jgi:thymidylate synthase ThyX